MGTTLIREKKFGADMRKLTVPQQMFVMEMLADKNFDPTAAARKAGYKTPSQAANKLLKNKTVAAVLGKFQKDRVERLSLDADRVVQELHNWAYLDVADLTDESGRIIVDDVRKIPEHARRCINGIKVTQWIDKRGKPQQRIELKMVSKEAAMTLLMKHAGMLAPQKIEMKHSVGIDWSSLNGRPNGEEVDVVEERLRLPAPEREGTEE